MNQYTDLLEIQSFGRVAFTWRTSRHALTLAPREEALLIYLADQGVTIGRTQLCEFFWPDETAARAHGNLRKLLADVRKGTGDFLGSNRDVVWLTERPYWFDLHEFARLTEAITHNEGRWHQLAETDLLRFAEGIRLYHGDFLANFKQPQSRHFVAWMEHEQRLLHQRAISVLLALISHAITQAELAKATAYVRRLIEIDPANEEAHGQLIRLLAHQGQRTEAIEHYQSYRQLVHKELKTTVEDELTELYRQIRSGVLPALLLDTPAKVVTRAERSQLQPHALPNPVTPLLGRTLLLTQLNDYLHNPAVRLVTLTGLGGVGKSRVALAVAAQAKRSFQDQVYYVAVDQWRATAPRGALTDQQCYNMVVQATAETLTLATDTMGGALDQEICAKVRSRTLLLIFDGFETIVEGAAFLLKLLQEAPAVKILVASREILQLPGEMVIQIEGLPWSTAAEQEMNGSAGQAGMAPNPVPSCKARAEISQIVGQAPISPAAAPAVDLFTSCAQRQNPALTFTADCLEQIAEICALLEGNPLAIELAAGLTSHYAYGELITLLHDNFLVLQAIGRGGMQRHRSIAQTLEESWLMLSSAEQETLASLSELPARFHRTEAIQQAGVSPHTIIRLTAKSMLRAGGQGWYQFPRMVQLFARQKRQQQAG